MQSSVKKSFIFSQIFMFVSRLLAGPQMCNRTSWLLVSLLQYLTGRATFSKSCVATAANRRSLPSFAWILVCKDSHTYSTLHSAPNMFHRDFKCRAIENHRFLPHLLHKNIEPVDWWTSCTCLPSDRRFSVRERRRKDESQPDRARFGPSSETRP